MREEELKFSVDAEYRLPDLVEPKLDLSAAEPAPDLELLATYFDTDDLRLARDGVTLRHRTGEGAPTWHLKLPVSGRPTVRDELSVEAPEGTPPESLVELLTARLRGGTVHPVAALRTARSVLRLLGPDGTELAEVVDDSVSVLDGERTVSTFREVEVERRGITDKQLARVSERLQASGAVAGPFTPKVLRALGPRAAEPPDLPAVEPVGPGDPAAAVVARSLRAGVQRLVAADAGVRLDSDDAVHQMRVACRRMRSDLRSFAPLVDPDWADGLRTELAWLADALGTYRDLEVLRARLQRTAVADPLAPLDEAGLRTVDALLEQRQAEARSLALVALAAPRYRSLLDLLVDAAITPRLRPAAQAPSARTLPPLVAVAWRRLDKGARRLMLDSPDDDWHRVRILAKRARYAAEAVAPALGADASNTARAATAVQEVLGEHQDAAIAATSVLDLVAADSDVTLAVTVGRLAERERAAVRAARVEFDSVWRSASRPRVTSWLRR